MEFLTLGPSDSDIAVLLAPGAGAPAASPWMEEIAGNIAAVGLAVARFDFAYMTARLTEGSRRPPPRAEALVAEYEAAVDALIGQIGEGRRIVIGGKSLGGRVASLAAQSLFERGRIAGLACLSYPFHPPKQPQALRTRHLMTLTCPTLIVQGERDPFGGREEVAGYGLPGSISILWMTDGDHDLAPRKSAGATREGNLDQAARAVAGFARSLA